MLVQMCSQSPLFKEHSSLSVMRNNTPVTGIKDELTAAVESIAVQAVPRVTETVEASLSVVTVLLTASIVGETLVDV